MFYTSKLMGSYKMRIIKIVIVTGIFSLVMLSACGVVSVSQKDPKSNKVISSEFNSSAKKLSENKEIIVNQIYQYIKEKHPVTAVDFPKIKIGNVVSSSYQKLEFFKKVSLCHFFEPHPLLQFLPMGKFYLYM